MGLRVTLQLDVLPAGLRPPWGAPSACVVAPPQPRLEPRASPALRCCELAAQRAADGLKRSREIAGDERRGQPQHAKPGCGERAVPARVSAALKHVMRAIHLHDQPRRRSEEVHDVALQHDLPPKPHAELRRPECQPEHALRLRRRDTHAMRVSRQLLLLAKVVSELDMVPLSDRRGAGRSPSRAGSVTRPQLTSP